MIELVPPVYLELFAELRNESLNARGEQYVDAMVDSLADHGRDLDAVRAASRLVRNLSTAEIIVAGDLGDRGPHIDRVIDYLMRQPNVSIVWGNHDVSWMGACLGQEALVATVVRFSLRYGRLAQLEEGYGITLQPLRELARKVYGDDPAEHFKVKGSDERDARADAEGDRDPPVQARRPDEPPAPRVGDGRPRPAAPHRPRGAARSRSTASGTRCSTATSPPSTPPTRTGSRPRSGRAWTGCGRRS